MLISAYRSYHISSYLIKSYCPSLSHLVSSENETTSVHQLSLCPSLCSIPDQCSLKQLITNDFTYQKGASERDKRSKSGIYKLQNRLDVQKKPRPETDNFLVSDPSAEKIPFLSQVQQRPRPTWKLRAIDSEITGTSQHDPIAD